VTISPQADTLLMGVSLVLAATLQDASGRTLSGRPIAWASLNPAIAAVTGSGVVTTVAIGTASITATSEGKSDTVAVLVTGIVAITRRMPSLFVGDTVQLAVRFTRAQGDVIPGPAPTWSAQTAAVAEISATGLVTAHEIGLSRVIAAIPGGADTQFVDVLAPRFGTNREIAYLHDTTRSDGASITELRTLLPGTPGSQRVSGLDELVSEYDWSPNGDRIVVSYLNHNGLGKAGLYVLNADGSGEVQVAPGGAHPRWSPDGNWIAYRSYTNPARIHVALANGGGSHPLTGGTLDDLDPEWSPDGRQLAFRRQSLFCEELWLMDADGTHERRLPVPVNACNFAWAPDGKEIALFGFPSIGAGASGVWIIRSDGSGFRALSPNCDDSGACPGGGSFDTPDWFPDASKVTVSANRRVLLSSRTGQMLDSIAVCCSDIHPAARWSPDGTKLTFVGTHVHIPSGTYQPVVGLMDADGANQTLLTDFHVASGSPRWRP
jgi:Tol biopolymer transport system component